MKWSKGSAPRGFDTTVGIPAALKIGGTYLIYSEVDYTYMPTVGYVMKTAIKLSDFMYTRPRYGLCVLLRHRHRLPGLRPLAAFPKQTKKAARPARPFVHSVEFREKLAAELRQPAARRLSADDLPERRSATIS